jgi:C-terminal processing protease CtpA/Prc
MVVIHWDECMTASRLVCPLLTLLMVTLAMGQDDSPLRRQRSLSGLRDLEVVADVYGRMLANEILPDIAAGYHFEELSKELLAGRAVLGLYQALDKKPPEALQRDPATFIKHHPGKDLREKLKLAREALGNASAISGDLAIHVSMRAVFQSLDPFSNYVSADRRTRITMEDGAGVGIHLEDKPLGGSYFIRAIDSNSLADREKLRPGDELLKINKEPIAPNTPTSQVNLAMTLGIRRRSGLQLTLRRLDGETREVTLQSGGSDYGIENLPYNPFRDTVIKGYRHLGEGEWSYWVDAQKRVAVIRLGSIVEPPASVLAIIRSLQNDGLKSLIVDLRDCPSGVPNYTAELTGLFLPHNATIATVDYRNGRMNESDQGKKQSILKVTHTDLKAQLEMPLAVLVGPETSGAAELMAAALQDHGRAKIVGQRTRGKSTIQTVLPQNDRQSEILYSYRLTVGIFSRPSGKPLHRQPGASPGTEWGVIPDVDVTLPAQVRRQVRAWWYEHDLREENSVTPTEIDDPRNDPVLHAALRLFQ